MTEEAAPAKLAFASPAWIAEARRILEELVAAHGRQDRRFSLCERFTDAPREIAPSGMAAWHFRIEGKSVEAGPGEIPDAEVTITADYDETLPVARLVYTPEVLAERAARQAEGPQPDRQGDMSRAPRYLVELHNRLALITA